MDNEKNGIDGNEETFPEDEILTEADEIKSVDEDGSFENTEKAEPIYDSHEDKILESLNEEIDKDEKTETKKQNKTQPRSFTYEIFEWIEIFSTALTALIIIFTFLFRLVTVEGISMEKTLTEKDNLIITHVFYQPKQNDIVVIQVPEIDKKIPLIKRVIATEGQKVDFDFENWKVIVDGVPLEEPYVNYEEGRPMLSDDVFNIYNLPLTVEKGKIFVMGDNRNHSKDSRNAEVKEIDIRNVVGKVLVRVFPIKKFGVVKPYVT